MTLSFLVFEVIGDGEVGFGLSFVLPSGEVRSVDSLTFDRAAIDMLCERMNRLGVTECQLYEILEDFLP
ncbi:MAG: hypothetical protein E7611_00505 [Ruminococcaceae bacterium]|nr:hypothetical protein [Oscillospiraceae bacterium]